MQNKQSFFKQIAKLSVTIFIGVNSFLVSIMFFLLVIVSIIGVVSKSTEDSSADPLAFQYKTIYGEKSNNNLLAISISGIILGDEQEVVDPFSIVSESVTFGYSVKHQIEEAEKDQDIKGIILLINSPGGTIYGSRVIADSVKKYKENTGNPVYSYISGIGASGAYYAASSSDAIFADHGTTIGSIGVIFGPIKYYDSVISEDGGILSGGVVTQNGIESTYITAGKSKDIGNPYRQLTQDEIRVLQQSVNNEYEEFVSYVSKSRKIGEDALKNRVGAMIYDNKSAKELGLIDETYNRDDAFVKLAEEAGISDGSYSVITRKQEPTFMQLLFSSSVMSKNSRSIGVCAKALSSVVLAYHGDLGNICR